MRSFRAALALRVGVGALVLFLAVALTMVLVLRSLLWRQLTTIALDAPLGDIATQHARGQADGDMLTGLSDALRFGPMTRRRLRVAAGLEDGGAGRL